MINNDITIFAETTFRNKNQKFGIKADDRRRHMYLIGKTGMGKSTILENMIIGDIRAGRGVAVVDPHGDLAEKIMQFIPEDRVRDVIYFNPGDLEYPIAFNIVEKVDVRERHLVASGLLGVFKKLWADSWGPRLEYILRNAILAILDYPGSTLLDVIRILSDKPFRKKVVNEVQDPVVKSFWQKEFAGYADKFASEAVSPIQNKVGQFLSSFVIRNIVGQLNSSINMREIMDSKKILIMNLSKGQIGEDNSALLGNMIITKIQMAAMSRVNIAESARKDFYLYIDEFQNFSTESFANILSEARKYRLNLIMAHQYIEQLDERVAAAVFGNVGTVVCFRVGATDAEELVKEFTPVFTEEDIVNLPKYEFYLKLMIDGIASDPFSARGLFPLKESEKTGNIEKVIEYSRQKYAKRKEIVEEEIMQSHFRDEYIQKNLEKNSPPGQNKTIQSEGAPAPDRGEQEGYQVKCSNCNKETRIPFVPDGVRPVYCKDCLSELKKNKRDGMTIPTQKKDRIDFSSISPSELMKREGISKKKEDDDEGVSLSSFKELASVDFKGKKQEVKEIAKKSPPTPTPMVANSSKVEAKKESASPSVSSPTQGTPTQGAGQAAKSSPLRQDSEGQASVAKEGELEEGDDIFFE